MEVFTSVPKMKIDKADFAAMRKELEDYDIKREHLIRDSRDIIRLSKQIIYSVHREELKQAESLAKKIRADVKKLPSDDFSTGMKKVALQEFVEAVALLDFVSSNRIPSRKALNVDTEAYLCGICDLSGELLRLAVNKAIKKQDKEVLEIRGFVEEIYGEFLQLDLRNGELRKKSDQIKWNMQKLEDIAYSISRQA